MSFVYGCTSTSFGLAALSVGSRHEMLEKRAPDELCKRLHLGIDFLRLSCSFAFRFRFLARDSGGQKQQEPSFQRVRGTKCSKKRAPDEFCVWLHLDLLRLSLASRFRFLARDSGGQRQREPSFQRVRGTKCSKRGFPMSFVYGCTSTCFRLEAALLFQKLWEPWFKRVRGTKCSKRGLPMSFVYGCTSTSFCLAAALRFDSCQDHKQDLAHSGGQKQREPWWKRVRGLPMSFVYGCTSTSFGLAAALSFGSRHEMLEKRAPDELCKRLHLGVDFLRLSCSFAFRFRFLARDSGGQKQREPSFEGSR